MRRSADSRSSSLKIKKLLLMTFVVVVISCLLIGIKPASANQGAGDENLFFIESLNENIESALEDSGIQPPLRIEEVFVVSEGNEKVITTEQAKDLYGWKKFSLTKVEFNEVTSKFKAEILGHVVAGEKNDQAKLPVQSLIVKGKVVKLAEVPVLNKTISNGEIISADDIEWVNFEEKVIKPSDIISSSALIGKTPTQRIMANKIIKSKDVELPVLVNKGETVNLVYSTEFIKLQTVGVALEKGKQGDNIKIQNSKSRIIVNAKVEDKGLATVNVTSANSEILASSF